MKKKLKFVRLEGKDGEVNSVTPLNNPFNRGPLEPRANHGPRLLRLWDRTVITR